MTRFTCAMAATLLLIASPARADFSGPEHAMRAMSPDGNLVVRLTLLKKAEKFGDLPKYKVAYYAYSVATDGFVAQSSFEMDDAAPNFLFVSDAGDLFFISLSESDAISLYAKDGRLAKRWSLKDFLSAADIEGCMETGSTLQWFNEAKLYDRALVFDGPPHRVRAVSSPMTIMRGYDEKVSFSGKVDAATGELKMFPREEEEESEDTEPESQAVAPAE